MVQHYLAEGRSTGQHRTAKIACVQIVIVAFNQEIIALNFMIACFCGLLVVPLNDDNDDNI